MPIIRMVHRGSAKVFFMGSNGPFNPPYCTKLWGHGGNFKGPILDPLTHSTVQIKGSILKFTGSKQWSVALCIEVAMCH